jgi:hypothetical protein
MIIWGGMLAILLCKFGVALINIITKVSERHVNKIVTEAVD